jgi:hypothetical protein
VDIRENYQNVPAQLRGIYIVSLEQNGNAWEREQWDKWSNQQVRQVMRIMMVEDQPCFIEVAPNIFDQNPAAQAAIDAATAAGRKPRYWCRIISEGSDTGQVA